MNRDPRGAARSLLRISILLAVGLAATPALAGNIAPFQTRLETDWTVAGVGGLRGIGTSSIQISGVSGTVDQAILYWHGPTNSDDPQANADVTFAGVDITGVNIGFSDDNLWNFDNSQAYRADVTALVSGDGTYSLANFRKSADIEINGASLVVFFDDGDPSNDRDVVLFDGNDANLENPFDDLGWNVTLSGIRFDEMDTADMIFGVSDGQDFGAGDDGVLTINGSGFAPPDLFEGATLPGGAGPTGNGNLWDLVALDVTGLLTPGDNATLDLSLLTDEIIPFDALSLVHVAVDLPAGAIIPEPGTFSLVALGLGMLAFRRP